MKKISQLLIAFGLLTLSSSLHAGTIVPYLDDADAVFDANTSTQNAATPAMTLASGVTLAALITPSAQDLANSSAGAVQVLELGGTSNGGGLWIINGDITFLSKFNTGTAYSSNFSDTDGSDGALAYSFGSLSSGISYDVWASLDAANSKLTLSLNGSITQLSLSNVSSTWNWKGNGGIDFGGLLDVPGRLGGLSDNSGAGVLYRANAIGLDGTASEGQIFNEIVVVPEPSVLAFGCLSIIITAMLLRTKHRSVSKT